MAQAKLSHTQACAPMGKVIHFRQRSAQHSKCAWECSRWPWLYFTTFWAGCSGWDHNAVPGQAWWLAVSHIQMGRPNHPAEKSHCCSFLQGAPASWFYVRKTYLLRTSQFTKWLYTHFPLNCTESLWSHSYRAPVIAKGMEAQPGRGSPKTHS